MIEGLCCKNLPQGVVHGQAVGALGHGAKGHVPGHGHDQISSNLFIEPNILLFYADNPTGGIRRDFGVKRSFYEKAIIGPWMAMLHFPKRERKNEGLLKLPKNGQNGRILTK